MDSLTTSHPISAKVTHPNQINELFDRISYGKGASIIRMMFHFLGEENFIQGLTSYLNKHKYGNAEQNDLWDSLTNQAHKVRSLDNDISVKTVMDTWTLQMGYPVINVNRNYEDNSMTITQERFLSLKNQPKKSGETEDTHDYKWWVPISFDFEGGKFNQTRNSHWLKPDQDKLTIQLPEGNTKILRFLMNKIPGNLKKEPLIALFAEFNALCILIYRYKEQSSNCQCTTNWLLQSKL